MFRRLLTIMLTIVLTHTCFAGISVDITYIAGNPDILAIYQFETFDFDDDFGIYTENSSGYDDCHGYFIGDFESDYLSESDRGGKCLLLQNWDTIKAYSEEPPQVGSQFSIVAWVKLNKQEDRTSLYFTVSGLHLQRSPPRSRIALVVESTGNIAGIQNDFPEVDFGISLHSFRSENQNIADNEWHHIAYSRHGLNHLLFIDGKLVAKKYRGGATFSGEFTEIFIGSSSPLTGDVFIDEVGIFRTGLSAYDMQGLYNDGLTKFLETMPVNPQDRMATTWGQLKSQ